MVLGKNGQGLAWANGAAVVGEPCCRIAGEPLAVGEPAIAYDDILAISGNGVAESVVAGKGQVRLPAFCKKSQTTRRGPPPSPP